VDRGGREKDKRLLDWKMRERSVERKVVEVWWYRERNGGRENE
jgi:hypothetical protein